MSSHIMTVAVRDPHPSAGPGHAVVTVITAVSHTALAMACLWSAGTAVPTRALSIIALRSYTPLSSVTCYFSWHDVSFKLVYSSKRFTFLLVQRTDDNPGAD
jgi:hypothetical protein